MKSIKETAKIYEKYDISLIFDVARWAENCYFIKKMKNDTKINLLPKLPQKCSNTVMVSACQLKRQTFKYGWNDGFQGYEDGSVKVDIGVLLKVKQI